METENVGFFTDQADIVPTAEHREVFGEPRGGEVLITKEEKKQRQP